MPVIIVSTVNLS